MTELLQGIFAVIIGGSFFGLLLAPFAMSGRISEEERIAEDRRRYPLIVEKRR